MPLGAIAADRGSPGLLPWRPTADELVFPAAAAAPPAAAELSLVDRLAAPSAFMHQALVFEHALDGGKLRAALGRVLALVPTLACRAAKDADGEWALCRPGAGALLTLGASPAAAASLAPLPVPALAPLADLGSELFGHLPSSLPGDAAAALELPLFQVALVALAGGGCVLGLRLSHLIADFATLRCALHHLARAYSGRPLAPGEAPVPAAPLVAALAASPPPPGAQPYNYLPLPPDVGAQFAALAAAPPVQGLRLHLPPARLAALKAAAAAEAAAAAAAEADGVPDGSSGAVTEAEPSWVSTNDALMAWLWRALAALPCRRGAVTAFNRGLDMRERLPPALGPPPRWVFGNLATSSYTPPLDAAALPLGRLALELRRTVVRDAAKFPADVALAAAGEAAGARCSSKAILPILQIMQAVADGRRPLVMCTQLELDYAADACFDGQLPVGAACSFGAALLPIAAAQPAPPVAGGGMFLYAWLRPDEAAELTAVLAAEQAGD